MTLTALAQVAGMKGLPFTEMGHLWEEKCRVGRGFGLVSSYFGHTEFHMSTRQLHENAE